MSLILLADGAAAGAGGGAPAGNPEGGSWTTFLFPLVMIGALFYFLLILPERKKQKALKDQLGGLKKNDRVVTIGGIYGTVANINRDADKVTLKVDDNSNVKIEFSLGAISRVVSAEIAADKADKDGGKSSS